MIKKQKKDIVGYVAVYSGQVIIVDPCYLSEWKDGEFKGDGSVPDNHYAKACAITLSKTMAGQMTIAGIAGDGVVSSTYDGDGNYPVYAERTKDGRIKSLTIQFTNEK